MDNFVKSNLAPALQLKSCEFLQNATEQSKSPVYKPSNQNVEFLLVVTAL